MKIFINARFLTQPISGVQRYGIECSRQILKLYSNVSFIAPRNIIHQDIAKELNVSVIGRRTGHQWEQLDLPIYLARQKYPPLLNLANTAPLFYSNNFITIHDLAFYHHPEWNTKKLSAWYNILIPRIAHKSRHLFTVSNTVLGELVKWYRLPAAKISVTPNGISQKMVVAGPYSGKKEKIILTVGTFNRRKNHQTLVAAFIRSGLGSTYELVIIGDRNKVFAESGLDETECKSSSIKIIDTLSEDELIDMYRKAEIVASVSLYEGFGIPLLEGLFNGCKVFCSDIPAYKEVYGDVAVFCDPMDIEGMSLALKTVTDDEAPDLSKVKGLTAKYNYGVAANSILERIVPGYNKK